MSENKMKTQVSKVMLQPWGDMQSKTNEKVSPQDKNGDNFQLNSLGGPLEEDFTSS